MRRDEVVASGDMDRREFLRLSAMAGAAAVLTQCSSGSSKAKAGPATTTTLPRPPSVLDGAPADSGIDTVVVAMMENRSFDSYFGWLARDESYLEQGRSRYGARFAVDGNSFQQFPGPGGKPVDTFRRVLSKDAQPWRGCGHPDPGHGWDAGRAERDGGFLSPGSGNDEFALSYFEGADLPLYDLLARRFTVCDRWHASVLGPTYPNREYLLSGTSGGHKDNFLPLADGGFTWPNIVDRLAAAKVPVAEYYSDLPPLLLWGNRMMPHIRKIDEFKADAAAGKLPKVAFVSPIFSGDNRSDDHPHGDPRAAQKFVLDAFTAFAKSPQWERGLFVLTYDEWGGFFDHVKPPILPDGRANKNDEDNFAASRLPRPDRARVSVRAAGLRRSHAVRPHVGPAVHRVAVPGRARTRSGCAYRQVVPHRARSQRQQSRRDPRARQGRPGAGLRPRREDRCAGTGMRDRGVGDVRRPPTDTI